MVDQLSLAPGDDDVLGGRVYLDETSTMMDYEELHIDESLFALATFGKNSDDGRDRHYLKTGGNEGRPLFRMVPGAVFASAESFNAVTMFLNYNTFQGKIVDFLHVGGTGAVGHGFEPMADAIINTQFLFENLLRDEDGDSVGDLCFAEAALDSPRLDWPWTICRCRLLSSTRSKSLITSRPTPAADRYIDTGEPSPPMPMINTVASRSFCCPASPICDSLIWRL